jgi:D-lactate dehydrogenase
MKLGALLINTARGGLVDTEAMISCLESGQLSGVGLDVVAGEESLFFGNHAHEGIINTAIAQLVNMPNVIMTPHQAFFTHEALTNIAEATLTNLQGWQAGTIPENNRL